MNCGPVLFISTFYVRIVLQQSLQDKQTSECAMSDERLVALLQRDDCRAQLRCARRFSPSCLCRTPKRLLQAEPVQFQFVVAIGGRKAPHSRRSNSIELCCLVQQSSSVCVVPYASSTLKESTYILFAVPLNCSFNKSNLHSDCIPYLAPVLFTFRASEQDVSSVGLGESSVGLGDSTGDGGTSQKKQSIVSKSSREGEATDPIGSSVCAICAKATFCKLKGISRC